MKRFKVVFQPDGKKVEVPEGSTVMEAINDAGLDFDFPCGGQGTCGKCGVKAAGEEETHLACQTQVAGDITIEIPNYKKLQHNILKAAQERAFELEPHLNKKIIEVAQPRLDAQRSDWHRLKDGLTKALGNFQQEPPISLLRQLPETLRNAKGCITAVFRGRELVGIEQRDTVASMFGMAFDIGTTTIVGYLIDLYSGQELSVVSTLNPQTKYGADVISRINYAGREADGLHKLHTAVIQAINKLLGEAAEQAGIGRELIYAVTIAANTTMHHLFLGISPQNIAVSPYVSAVNEPVVVKALELGLNINRAGMVFVLPNIAGFVGADTTAVLLAAELDRSQEVKLIVDIGTNGEIALGCGDKIAVCSAAAGPAFEGAQISSGMRGAAGAMDYVFFKERLEYSVIGGGSPIGICGSALLDIAAGLLELGIIDKRGRLLSPDKLTNPAAEAFKDRLLQHEGQPAFLLADAAETGHGRPIVITQSDIRELQLAKGAMAAGVQVLLQTLGITTGEIKEVLLAGAFGNYLNPRSACIVGLIPQGLEAKIKTIGNAAGTGAKLSLLSAGEYQRAADIAQKVSFVELGSYPKFNSIFAQCTYFMEVK